MAAELPVSISSRIQSWKAKRKLCCIETYSPGCNQSSANDYDEEARKVFSGLFWNSGSGNVSRIID